MSDLETIDSEGKIPDRKRFWTIWFLLITLTTTAVSILLTVFDGELGIPHKYVMQLIPIGILTSIGFSLIGFIFGLIERKYNRRKALIGIIGNLVILVFYILSVIWAINMSIQMRADHF